VGSEAIGSGNDQRRCQAGPEGIGEGAEGARAAGAGQGSSTAWPPDQWSSRPPVVPEPASQ